GSTESRGVPSRFKRPRNLPRLHPRFGAVPWAMDRVGTFIFWQPTAKKADPGKGEYPGCFRSIRLGELPFELYRGPVHLVGREVPKGRWGLGQAGADIHKIKGQFPGFRPAALGRFQ